MSAVAFLHLIQALLIKPVFFALMRMSVQQNLSTPHLLPGKNRIMTQHQTIFFLSDRIVNFFIVTDFRKQLLISVVGYIIMISPNQNLASF